MQRLPTGSLIDGKPMSRCQLVLIDTKREWCPVSLVAFAVPRPARRTPNTNQMDEHQQQLTGIGLQVTVLLETGASGALTPDLTEPSGTTGASRTRCALPH